jgi:hypothetical protein
VTQKKKRRGRKTRKKNLKEFLIVGCIIDREVYKWHFTGMTQGLYLAAFYFWCHPTLLITFTKLD